MIIAVDYDGTLEKDGKPNLVLIGELRRRQSHGDVIILWTCRTGNRLGEAVKAAAGYGLRFNYVNENAPAAVRMLGGNPRKIYADVYIDDKAAK